MEGQQTSREAVIDATLRLSPEPASVAKARRFVGSTLGTWGETGAVDVVVLLTSEVVTNAVLHAGPHHAGEEMVMELVWDEDVIRVEVKDHAGRLPVARHIPGALGGRGLPILDALASAWGVTPCHSGKVVWFEVQA